MLKQRCDLKSQYSPDKCVVMLDRCHGQVKMPKVREKGPAEAHSKPLQADQG